MYSLALELVALAVDDIGGTHLVNHFSGEPIALSLADSVGLRVQLVVRI